MSRTQVYDSKRTFSKIKIHYFSIFIKSRCKENIYGA